jgi:hypothetical protein
MNASTLHKTYNKELEKMNVMAGNCFSNLQSSIYVRSINDLKCGNFDFAKGELFTYDLNTIAKFSKTTSFPSDFHEKLYEICEKSSACVYVFHNPAGSNCISFAISTKEGLQYFHEVSKSEKQKSINEYIIKTMNEQGWF